MRTPKAAYAAAALSALLAACSAAQQTANGVSGSSLIPQSQAISTALSPRYVYLSDAYGNFVDEFDRSGNLVTRITAGMHGPGGLYVDGSHNLWVANGTNILMFPEGAKSPARTLQDPGGGASDATMGTDGTVYVANVTGTISIYAPGHNTPTRSLRDSSMQQSLYITVDPNNDLFVTCALKGLPQFVGRVDEYAHARQSGLTRFSIWLGSPGGIVWRNGMVYVSDITEHTVTELTTAGARTGRKLVTGGPWDGIDVSPEGMVLGADQQFIQGITRHFPLGKIGMTYHDPQLQMVYGAAFQTDQGGN